MVSTWKMSLCSCKWAIFFHFQDFLGTKSMVMSKGGKKMVLLLVFLWHLIKACNHDQRSRLKLWATEKRLRVAVFATVIFSERAFVCLQFLEICKYAICIKSIPTVMGFKSLVNLLANVSIQKLYSKKGFIWRVKVES